MLYTSQTVRGRERIRLAYEEGKPEAYFKSMGAHRISLFKKCQ
jgi:hypothetical protein